MQAGYWNYEFLGHALPANLIRNFNTGLSGFDFSRLVQVSTDRPSVREGLLNLGSCNFHVAYGALQTATEDTGWKSKATLKGSHQLLKDTPAHRKGFVSATGSKMLPMSFCTTRYAGILYLVDPSIKNNFFKF